MIMTKNNIALFAKGRDCRIAQSVRIPMRDGTELCATLYLPLQGCVFPSVLVRTAYNRTYGYDPYFTTHDMALIVQDTRGRYDSEGTHNPFVNEAEDGADTIRWIAIQPWCNGQVGMYGPSYLAAVQFLAAPLCHGILKAAVPMFMAGDCWKHAYYCDGAFSLALTWSWLCFEVPGRISKAPQMTRLDVKKILMSLPVADMDILTGAGRVPAFQDYVRRNRYGGHPWELLNVRARAADFQTPALLIGGWYDNYAAEAANTFLAFRRKAATQSLRDSHRLLIGPWSHGFQGTSKLGEMDYGPDAIREDSAPQRWLDTLLHDQPPSAFMLKPVRLFVMGINQWRDEDDWPLPRTRYTPFYLGAGGRLDTHLPTAHQNPDLYIYDPADPVFTLGGNHSVGPYNPGLYDFCKPGAFDQRQLANRTDILSYVTDPLASDTEVTGHVKLVLYASSSAPDTDFVARLIDVHPDGRAMNITEGVIRARFREDLWGAPKLMDPGTVYAFTIDLQVTSNVFFKGHRIRLDVTSSNFPLWDRNLNTGHDPATDTEMRKAKQTLHHDPNCPSHLMLPLA
ncbi:MAG: CocE/NonD family hydrolase [bacterium]